MLHTREGTEPLNFHSTEETRSISEGSQVALLLASSEQGTEKCYSWSEAVIKSFIERPGFEFNFCHSPVM